jgi:exopolysaccharide biosynthesis polyprenyl glycosylphosphotransferase
VPRDLTTPHIPAISDASQSDPSCVVRVDSIDDKGVGLTRPPPDALALPAETPGPLGPDAKSLRALLPSLRFGERGRSLLITAGQVSAVGVPVLAVMAAFSSHDSRPRFVATAFLLIAIWWFTLRRALSSPHLSPFTVGLAFTSLIGALTGLAGTSAIAFWLGRPALTPRDLALMTAGVFAATLVWETAVRRVASRRRRVLVVGESCGGRELVERLRRSPQLPFDCVGVIGAEHNENRTASLPRVGDLTELAAVVKRTRPDLVVLAGHETREAALGSLLEAMPLNLRVAGLSEFYEYVFGRVPIRHLTPMWFMSVLHLYQKPYPRAGQRLLDLVLAGAALIICAPLFVVVAWLIFRSSRGPILYRQMRVGQGGECFEMLKFRSMYENAEVDGNPVWAAHKDERVTRLGRFLRHSRLDELPQLWNVLRGEMSMVGPRPERPELLPVLEKEVPLFSRRHMIKPGITGWAQTRSGYAFDVDSTAEKLSFDLYYVRHRSLALDIAILLKTTTTLFTGFGAR